MASSVAVARCASLAGATRNSDQENATAGATHIAAHVSNSPMTGRELRAQLRAQQERNKELRGAQLLPPQELRESGGAYRWLVCWPSGEAREITALPEMMTADLVRCYPGARFLPLPDSAVKAGELIYRRTEIAA